MTALSWRAAAALVAAVVLPVALLALVLARPGLDARWESHPAHFWLVLAAAAISTALGYAVAVAASIFQRVVRELVARRAAAATDVRTSLGLTAASMILRGWLVAFAIFAVGLRDPKAGLAAAVLFLFLFSIFFTMQAILRPVGTPGPARGSGP